MSIANSTRAAMQGACCLALTIAGMAALSLACFTGMKSTVHAASNEEVKQGETIFHEQCIKCHNKQPGDTSPFGPPNLHGVFHAKPGITTAEAMHIISHGKGNMPPFGSTLTAGSIQSVIAYLKTQ